MKFPIESSQRVDLWIQILNQVSAKSVAEIGVWKGAFAGSILNNCPNIQKYFMIDPWEQLSDWNKPFNVSNTEFKHIYEEAVKNTDFAAEKRIIFKG
jgi:hypothetical protein